MTSEGTDTLILAFTSKTGQSVARLTHRIVLFGFFNQREDIFTHFIGQFQALDIKGSREITKQRGFFALFNRFLARLNQHRCPATLIYGTTFPGSTKTHSTSPAGWEILLKFAFFFFT